MDATDAAPVRPGYRDAYRIPGSLAFSATGFVARMPLSIIGLGIVLYIAGTTGSYAAAGAMGAAYALTGAAMTLLTSRLVDRRGQSRVLPLLVPLHAALLLAFVASVEGDAPVAVPFLLIAAAGGTQPSIGSLVRARWAHAVTATGAGMPVLRRAFAIESILDEIIFAVGPLIAAFSAQRIGLPAPLVIGAALVLAGGLALSAQRSTQPPPHPSALAAKGPGAIRQRGILAVAGVGVGLGAVFGSYEVTAVAFAERLGQPAASGIILALWAGGSAVGGLWFGARQWTVPLPTQLVAITAVLALVLVPAMAVRTIPWLAVATLLSGAAVAPGLIAFFSSAERLMPRRLLTEGLTIANSALSVGFAAGSAVAGAVVDALGTTAAFAIPVIAAAGGAAVSAARRTALIDAMRARTSADGPDLPPVAAAVDEPVPGPGPFDAHA